MKKIVVWLILSISVMGMLAGCSKKNNDDNLDNNLISPTPEVTDDEDVQEDNEDNNLVDGVDLEDFVPLENPVVKEEYDYKDYIKLGQYKGIEVKVDKLDVTEEDIDVIIQMDLLDNGSTPVEVTDRDVRLGDVVNIDFIGYHKGEPFEGGAAEGFELTVGSKVFISGFEEQLVGAQIGNEIDVNVVFPTNYNNTDLAGEPAVFKVKVNGIKNFELTEDFVKETMGFETEAEYRDSIRQELVLEYADRMIRQKENEVYTAVINGSEITMPENLLEYYEEDIKTMYTNEAAIYGMDLETILSIYGSSMEEFEQDAKAYAKNMVIRELIIKAISNAEGIEITEDEFQTTVAQYAAQYGYESNEEFLEQADTEMLRQDLLFYKIIEFLVAEAVEI
ncbi:MAG: trigger factor [Clostridiales bacterium]|nr:trigger factor [Clostridiales bacterium]